MSFPYEYLPEILAIAKENKVSWDIGFNMFTKNIKDANVPDDPYFYHGADELNYAEILAEHPEVTEPEAMSKMTNEFNDWYRENIQAIQAMYAQGDTEGLRELDRNAVI